MAQMRRQRRHQGGGTPKTDGGTPLYTPQYLLLRPPGEAEGTEGRKNATPEPPLIGRTDRPLGAGQSFRSTQRKLKVKKGRSR